MDTKLILGLYIVKAGSLFKHIDQFTNLCHSQMAISTRVQIIMTAWVMWFCMTNAKSLVNPLIFQTISYLKLQTIDCRQFDEAIHYLKVAWCTVETGLLALTRL